MKSKTLSPEPWKVLSSRTGYSHPFFTVREDEVQLPSGVIIPDYTIWENGDVAQTVVIHQGKTILVQLYKHGAEEIITEFPGGFINPGETPRDAARRELREETGVIAHSLTPLTTCIHHPTKETGRTHLFLATDVEFTDTGQNLDDTEDITTQWIPFDDIFTLIQEGKIVQTGTIAAAFLAREKLKSKGLKSE